MKKGTLLKNKGKKGLIRGLFGFFSLSAMLFIFQACYGTPQDFGLDVRIQGSVTSQDEGTVLRNIKVSLGNEQYTNTDENGRFEMYCPRQDNYQLRFADVDGNENGAFLDLDTVLNLIPEQEVLTVDVKMKD